MMASGTKVVEGRKDPRHSRRKCQLSGCLLCKQQRDEEALLLEEQLDRDRLNYILSIKIWDTDGELNEYDDIGSFGSEADWFVIRDPQGRIIAGFKGNPLSFETSRVDRLESTDNTDELKDDSNDTATDL